MIPALIASDVEVQTEEALERWGAVPAPAASGDGGHTAPTLVVAIARHKHAGVEYLPGQQYLITDPADVARNLAREAIHVPSPAATRWWDAPGRALSPFAGDAERPLRSTQTPGALRIVQGVGYDPGCAAYRAHSAVNVGSKHASAFVRFGDTNPYTSLRQYDGIADAATVRNLVFGADVIHCHTSYILVNNTGTAPREDQLLVMHYHGSRPDGVPLCAEKIPNTNLPLLAWDAMRGAKVLGARLTLVDDITRFAQEQSINITPAWFPIPVDVPRYRALRTRQRSGMFRVAHSPTDRSYKGTKVFRRVCERLAARGLAIEPVMIERRPHGEALQLKASCDAVFDSFWLGMQGSGLEGAAMGLPVIAGDPDAADAHRALCGHVPYTYANDEGALEKEIERLALDPAYCASEAARVSSFVAAHHDYPAVARRYEAQLAQWMGRSDVLTEA